MPKKKGFLPSQSQRELPKTQACLCHPPRMHKLPIHEAIAFKSMRTPPYRVRVPPLQNVTVLSACAR